MQKKNTRIKNFLHKLIEKLSEKKKFKTGIQISRNQIITRKMLGRNFSIYNGKKYINIGVVRLRLGHKFGEFAPTRRAGVHKKKKRK